MTFEELHKILDDENRKLSLSELQNILYELKQDCFHEEAKLDPTDRSCRYYAGEQNAFYICLDLLEHLDVGGEKPQTECKFCKTLAFEKDNEQYCRHRETHRTEYSAALCVDTIYTGGVEEFPCGHTTFANMPLNYCPECGRKL